MGNSLVKNPDPTFLNGRDADGKIVCNEVVHTQIDDIPVTIYHSAVADEEALHKVSFIRGELYVLCQHADIDYIRISSELLNLLRTRKKND